MHVSRIIKRFMMVTTTVAVAVVVLSFASVAKAREYEYQSSCFFRGISFVEKPNFNEQDKVVLNLVESFESKKQRPSLECKYIKFDK